MRLFVAAFLLATTVVPALAHHPFTPYYEARAFSGREATFADGSTIPFGPTPADGDRWQCLTEGCSYTNTPR